MVSQGATGLVTGVFGLTRFGNPSFFAADWRLDVCARPPRRRCQPHRASQAYSGARQFLAMDSSLDPGSRSSSSSSLDHLALNPRENDISHEATLAREQYAALLHYADSPRGAAKLERTAARSSKLTLNRRARAHCREPRARLHARTARRLQERSQPARRNWMSGAAPLPRCVSSSRSWPPAPAPMWCGTPMRSVNRWTSVGRPPCRAPRRIC